MYQYLPYLSQPDARLEVDISWVEDEWAGTDVWAELSVLAINSKLAGILPEGQPIHSV